NFVQVMMFHLYLYLVLDILNVLISLFLWKFNERKLVEEKSFDLSLSFHRRQILYAMEQFLPVSALHTLFYLVFFCSTFLSLVIKSRMSPGWYLFTSIVVGIFPHYCYLCPLCFLILIKRGHFKRISHVHNMINPERKAN
ncbi:hypothetical protein PMAYCL1PPCAC_08204, partial [Pristionchus mayeri]